MANVRAKVLCPDDHVRIGRNQSCELVIPCPYISGVHCTVEVEKSSKLSSRDSSKPLKCSVQDLSSNGTWVLKGDEEGRSSKPVKLSKGTKVDLRPGDCILLLAPQHKLCAQYKFMLQYNVAAEDVVGDGKLVLVQLPQETLATDILPSKNPSSTKMDSMVGNSLSEANSEAGLHIAKRKSACESASKEVGSYRDSKIPRLETTSISPDHTSSSARKIKVGVKRKIQIADDSSEIVKRPKIAHEELSSSSTEKVAATLKVMPEPNAASATSVPSLTTEVSKERCPTCLKLFPIVELPTHCAICQETTNFSTLANKNTTRSTEEEGDWDTTDGVTKVESVVSEAYPIPLLRTEMSMEQCPRCSKLFPVLELVAHAEVCTRESSRVVIDIDPDIEPSTHHSFTPTSMHTMDVCMEECPNCFKLFTVCELVDHCKVCRSHRNDETGTTVRAEPVAVIKSSGYSLERYSDSAIAASVSVTETSSVVVGKEVKTKEDSASVHMEAAVCASGDDLEQCVYCLQDFPVTELIGHVNDCLSKDMRNKSTIEEHCQHCLKVFPLDELVTHALNCNYKRNLGSLDSELEEGVLGSQDVWGEPVERCMLCFKDFPLSVLVKHSWKCTGDLLGSAKRFKSFLPSIHDLDPMALTVLTDTQMSAVEYVLKKSKEASERVYPQLLNKVLRLGFTEKDLERTLQWIRQDAPIIIHVKLDCVLQFLLEDTHYRNLFEVGTGRGSTDFSARKSWEDRIFNGVYKHSVPNERVKYGVLNIVGDPRGVRCCYGYGDSFLQLKKVRLRTTFASADTSYSTVQLSCCEHYSNVLNEYSGPELKAILSVATRRKTYLRSDVISLYKEVQIHGPVCLSENVDCIVVNDCHMHDTAMRKLLDKFVERNKCNLIWMEPESTISYPSLTTHPTAASVASEKLTLRPSSSGAFKWEGSSGRRSGKAGGSRERGGVVGRVGGRERGRRLWKADGRTGEKDRERGERENERSEMNRGKGERYRARTGRDGESSGKDGATGEMDGGTSEMDRGRDGRDGGRGDRHRGRDEMDRERGRRDSGRDRGRSGRDRGRDGRDRERSGRDRGRDGRDRGGGGRDRGGGGRDRGRGGRDKRRDGRDGRGGGKDRGGGGWDEGKSGRDGQDIKTGEGARERGGRNGGMCERDGEKGGSNQGARDRERDRRIGGRDGRNGGYCERDESRGKKNRAKGEMDRGRNGRDRERNVKLGEKKSSVAATSYPDVLTGGETKDDMHSSNYAEYWDEYDKYSEECDEYWDECDEHSEEYDEYWDEYDEYWDEYDEYWDEYDDYWDEYDDYWDEYDDYWDEYDEYEISIMIIL